MKDIDISVLKSEILEMVGKLSDADIKKLHAILCGAELLREEIKK